MLTHLVSLNSVSEQSGCESSCGSPPSGWVVCSAEEGGGGACNTVLHVRSSQNGVAVGASQDLL